MATFKTKRRPDSVSSIMSLDQHIGVEDPHPQYLLRSALGDELNINILDLLPIVIDRSTLSAYTTVPTHGNNVAVDAYVINLMNVDISTNKTKMETLETVTVPGLTERIETAEETVAGMVATVNGLRTDVDELTENHNTLKGRHDLLSDNFDNLSTSYNTLSVKVGDLSKVGEISIIDRLMDHTKVYTQADALGDSGSVTSHVDNTGLNLYAARTHTHTLVELGMNPVHENIISANISLDTLFADKNHNHDTRYPTRSELTSVGIYECSVSVGSITIDDATGEEILAEQDLDEQCTQGTYYFDRSKVRLINAPYGVYEGLLTVFTTTSEEYPITIYQMMYTDDMSWKRIGTTDIITSETTDPETNELIQTSEAVTTFTDWIPLVETAPIGSLLFDTGSNIIPKGYVEANGAVKHVVSYPLLWKYVLESGSLVTHDDWMTGMQGSYGLSEADTNAYVGTKTISTADIDAIYVCNADSPAGKHFVKLTEDNIDIYTGTSCKYIEASILENYTTSEVTFNLPLMGDRFLKMWVSGSSNNVGSYEEAGLPNITGTGRGVGIEASYTGALVIDEYNNPSDGIGGYNGSNSMAFSFNASRSSSIYGNSATVTPENISVHVYIKAYNGALIKEDRTEAQIREIIQDLIGTYQYATTSVPGLVELATSNIINGVEADNPTQPSVVTAAQLIEKDSSNVKEISIDGTNYRPVGNSVALPNFALVSGNRIAVLNMAEGDTLNCTAIKDDTYNSRYYDFVVPEDVVEKMTIDEDHDWIDYVDLNVGLKCISTPVDDQYDLGYPVGALVHSPLCANKSIADFEHLSQPFTTIFVDNISYADARAGVISSIVPARYVVTEDTEILDNKKYYVHDSSTDVYTEATVTVGSAIPEGTVYYERHGAGISDNKRIIVRLYWPLMWYIKQFAPMEGETAKVYPMMLPSAEYLDSADGFNTETVLEQIAQYMSHWTVVIKMSL